MEKFLLLVRRFLGASFEVLKREGWEMGEVEVMVGGLEEGPLSVGDLRLPMGLRYHVIDIYVDELERVGALEKEVEEVVSPEVLEKLLEPLRKLAKDCPTKMVRIKAKEALEDERLPGNERQPEDSKAEGGDNDDSDGWGGCED